MYNCNYVNLGGRDVINNAICAMYNLAKLIDFEFRHLTAGQRKLADLFRTPNNSLDRVHCVVCRNSRDELINGVKIV